MKKLNEFGRSMVEMLGVLAIIGVLSAGALAGYSKAMMQHRLNKHTDEISYLLATVIYNSDKLKDASRDMIDELSALGAFTWDIKSFRYDTTTEGKNTHFYDSLNNLTWFEHDTNQTSTAFCVWLPDSDYQIQVCRNYINIFKNLADELDMIYVTKAQGKARMRNTYVGKTCTSEKCLKTMTNQDIIDICQTHCTDADHCILYALFGYPASTVQNLLNSQ